LSTTLLLSTLTSATPAVFAANQPVIGLSTKAEAKKAGAKLLSDADKKDGDNYKVGMLIGPWIALAVTSLFLPLSLTAF